MRYEYNPFAGFFGSRKHIILESNAIVWECLFGDKDRAGLYEYLFIFPIITRILVDREIISKKSALGIFLSLISAVCFTAFAVTLALPLFILGSIAAAFMKSKYSKAFSPTEDILDATLVSENDMTMRDYIKKEFSYLCHYQTTYITPEDLINFLSAKYYNERYNRYILSRYFDENLTLWQESTSGSNFFSLTGSDPKKPLLQIALVEKNIKAITAMRELGIISSRVYSHAIDDINSRRPLITNIVSSTTSIVDIIMSYDSSYIPTAKRTVTPTLQDEAVVTTDQPELNTNIESLDEDDNRARLRNG